MIPAQERLDADELARIHAILRLIMQHELILADRAVQFGFEMRAREIVLLAIAEHAERVAARALRGVHRHVGADEERFGCTPVLRIQRDADRAGHRQALAFDLDRTMAGERELAARARDAFLFEDARQDHRELVAARSRGHGALGQRLLNAPRDRAQHGIAGDMARRVVDGLEAIDIDEEIRERRARFAAFQERIHHRVAVGEAGEAVGVREPMQFLQTLTLVGGIDAHAHDARHHAVLGHRIDISANPARAVVRQAQTEIALRRGARVQRRAHFLAQRGQIVGMHALRPCGLIGFERGHRHFPHAFERGAHVQQFAEIARRGPEDGVDVIFHVLLHARVAAQFVDEIHFRGDVARFAQHGRNLAMLAVDRRKRRCPPFQLAGHRAAGAGKRRRFARLRALEGLPRIGTVPEREPVDADELFGAVRFDETPADIGNAHDAAFEREQLEAVLGDGKQPMRDLPRDEDLTIRHLHAMHDDRRSEDERGEQHVPRQRHEEGAACRDEHAERSETEPIEAACVFDVRQVPGDVLADGPEEIVGASLHLSGPVLMMALIGVYRREGGSL